MLTPTRPAASSSGLGAGSMRWTSVPATSRRSNPCQPRATNGAGSPAHSGPSSAATGPRNRASFARHSPGSCVTAIGSAADRQRWRRPSGRSMFSNTGPCASAASATSTPASRSRSSSPAFDASRSTPTSARTRRPNRARVSDPYVTAPPSRQPRGSAVVTSRDAAPTTSTVGRATVGRGTDAAGAPLTFGPNGGRVYPAGPFPKNPEPFLVFLRAARRRR